MSLSRSRSWVFTINNYEDEDIDQVLEIEAKYLCFGFEVSPDTGTPHIQGYVYFKDQHPRSYVSKLMPRAYLAISRGSPTQNRKYCSKSGDFYEFGSLPVKGRLKLEQIAEIYDNPDDNFQLYKQYSKVYEEYLERTHNLDHERFVFLVSIDNLSEYISKWSPEQRIKEDYECWNGEECLILAAYSSFPFKDWSEGTVPRVKRGYQIKKIDPRVVVIYYSDLKEKNFIINKYCDIIDSIDG